MRSINWTGVAIVAVFYFGLTWLCIRDNCDSPWARWSGKLYRRHVHMVIHMFLYPQLLIFLGICSIHLVYTPLPLASCWWIPHWLLEVEEPAHCWTCHGPSSHWAKRMSRNCWNWSYWRCWGGFLVYFLGLRPWKMSTQRLRAGCCHCYKKSLLI